MNIVHVITKGDVGGAQTNVVALAAAQVAAGHRVTVVAGSDGPAMHLARSSGSAVVVLDRFVHSLSPRDDRATVRDLVDVFRGASADVVHSHSSKGGLLARIAARRAGVPAVYTAHGFPFQRGAPMAQRVQSYLGELVGGRLGDSIICLTDEEAALARRSRLAPSDRIVVVPNGLPDDAPLRSGPASDGIARLVMVARFTPPKRQRDLIDVLADMTESDWVITFVGDGQSLDEVRAHAAERLGERAVFLGHRDDVARIVADHDIALLWSGYEGMPIALLEAMRAGLASVASDLPGVRRLFGDDGGFAAGDADELRSTLHRLVNDSEAIDAAGRRARQRFLDEFTVDAMAAAIDEVYERVVTDPVRGRSRRR